MLPKEEAAKKALEFLHNHNVGHIATASLSGQPFVSPVYYAALSDFSIYFSTSHNTDKFNNLILNPRIAFSVGAGPDYIVLAVTGTAHLLEGKERDDALKTLESLVDAPMATWPIKAVPTLEKSGVALFKITPEKVTFLNLNSKEQLESVAEYYYAILP